MKRALLLAAWFMTLPVLAQVQVPAPVLAPTPTQTPRSSGPAAAFRKANACPATGKVQRTCAGWVINHIEPLCAGGADIVANMEWEQAAPSFKRDAFERRICVILKPTKEKK